MKKYDWFAARLFQPELSTIDFYNSGVTPEKGIITAIVAGFIISFLGGSKVQIGGPTGAFIIIIYGIIQEYGLDGLMVATILAGIFLILLGVFKLGTIVKYIPYPIIVNYLKIKSDYLKFLIY